MSKKQILLLTLIDIGLPIIVGTLVWIFLNEPLNALLLALLVVVLALLAQIYIKTQRSGSQKPPFPAVDKLVNKTEVLWNRNHSNELFKRLLVDKIGKMGNELSPAHFYGRQQEIEERGILLAKEIKNGAFLTFLANFQDYWSTISPYFEQTRIAASKKKKDISRVFICDGDTLQNVALLQLICEDHIANIKTYIVLKEHVTEKEILKDFGIWDGSVLCLVEKEVTTGTTIGCEYTSDETRLKNALVWKDKLMSYAQNPIKLLETRLPFVISETTRELQESASLAEQWAKECSSTFLGGGSCNWYHGAWQYLRLLDSVASPDWHQQFYKDTLIGILNHNPNSNILISGVADYGMLNHVFNSAKAVQANPDITVLDMCETPLRLCQWYAKRHNFTIHTTCDNITTTKLRQSYFDIIVSDEFLTVVSKSNKQDVVSKWGELLKSGGKVVTTVMWESNGNERLKLEVDREQREAYVHRVIKLVHEQAVLIWPMIAHREIDKLVREYAMNMNNYAVNSKTEVVNLFAGFNTSISIKDIPGEFVCPGKSFEILATKL